MQQSFDTASPRGTLINRLLHERYRGLPIEISFLFAWYNRSEPKKKVHEIVKFQSGF